MMRTLFVIGIALATTAPLSIAASFTPPEIHKNPTLGGLAPTCSCCGNGRCATCEEVNGQCQCGYDIMGNPECSASGGPGLLKNYAVN